MSDGWIEWKGGECPVHPDTVVDIEFRDGDQAALARASWWDWPHEGNDSDITRYRIVRPPLDFHTSGAPVRADDVQQGGDHYRTMDVQPWAAMQAWMTPEQFAGYLRGCALKYLARAGSKGPTLDEYRKARHYLDKLIETMEGGA